MKLVVYLALVAIVFSGWIMNIVKLVQMDQMNGMMAARIIGVPLVVLGSVLGWF